MALAEAGYSVDGFDLSNVRIRLAKEIVSKHYTNLKGSLNFYSGDLGEPIPGSKNEYDVTLLCAVLEHVPNEFELLRECYKRTKSGGHIIISVPNIAYIKHILALLFGKVQKREHRTEIWLTGNCMDGTVDISIILQKTS